jgi:hypothetical protein
VTTGLDFDGPELNPVPIPDQVPSAFQPDPWGFLEFVDPIGDAQMLAFQVSQLTVGMGELKRRLETVESWARGEIESGLIVIPPDGCADDAERIAGRNPER